MSGGELIEQAGLKVDRVDKVEVHLHRHGQVDTSPSPTPLPAIYLPLKPTNFVGRDEYFEKLRTALVPEPGMFSLSGDPGSGKSTLAQMFAWQVQKQFDAVVYQTCGQRSVETIVGELADTLKEQIGDEITRLQVQEKIRLIRNWLQQRRSLLVLDDVWLSDTTAGSDADIKFQHIFPNPPASVLFTSRRPSLPWVGAEQSLSLEAFKPKEVEDVFRLYLRSQTLERHKQELLQFAERVERLPIAVAVAAQLLQNEFGPLDQATRQIKLSELRTQIHDVPGLLQRAIDAQGESEQKLLLAASVCVPEGFWLPLAIEVAGLDTQTGATARNHLVNAGLLRLIDQDRQRFQLHSLLGEQLHSNGAVGDFRVAHASALTTLFRQWETRWRDCRECLKEIPSAVDYLGPTSPEDAWKLSFLAFLCAKRIGELETALQIEQQQEAFWLKSSNQSAKGYLEASYGNQALILQDWGRLEEALALHKKQEAICLELGNKDGLQASYGNQALILQDWGRLEEALALHKKQEAICLESGNQNGLQASYGNQARILQSWGRLEEALALYKKQEAICLELGNKGDLQISYGNQARILGEQGQLEAALELLKKKETLCTELGDRASLAYCYWVAQKLQDVETATEKLKAALAIFAELKMPRQIDAVKADLNPKQTSAAAE